MLLKILKLYNLTIQNRLKINCKLVFAAAAVDLEPPDQSLTGVSALKYKVTKVGEMRKDIDNLRELISTKYAEDMGENLNCTTQ